MSDPTPDDEMEALRREASEQMPENECNWARLKWAREQSPLHEIKEALQWLEHQLALLEEAIAAGYYRGDMEFDDCLKEIKETIKETHSEVDELRDQLLTLKSCIVTMFPECRR